MEAIRRELLFRLLAGKVPHENLSEEDFAAAELLAASMGVIPYWLEVEFETPKALAAAK